MSDEQKKAYLETWDPELAGCQESCLCATAECLGKNEEIVVSQVLVKFERSRKVARATHGQLDLAPGDRVVVETDRGSGVAVVITAPNRALVDRRSLRRVLKRIARPDEATRERLRKKERQAHGLCQQHITARNLPMRLVGVEFLAGETRAIFYFSAEGRVDFRDLVRALARDLRARIEMRQIGVRDQAKMVGGVGLCGRELCCSSFLRGFDPVTIKMAKVQGLVLNPQKVSGQCGRLLCCLAYEHEQYREARKGLPKVGGQVVTPDGPGRVRELDILRRRIRVAVEGQSMNTYEADEVARPGDPPPKRRTPVAEPAEMEAPVERGRREPSRPRREPERPRREGGRPAQKGEGAGGEERKEGRRRRRRSPRPEGDKRPQKPNAQGAQSAQGGQRGRGERPAIPSGARPEGGGKPAQGESASSAEGEGRRRRSRRGGRRRRGRGKGEGQGQGTPSPNGNPPKPSAPKPNKPAE